MILWGYKEAVKSLAHDINVLIISRGPRWAGRCKKEFPSLKICMWMEDRDSISSTFDREWKNREIENWIQEDDLRYF